MSNNEGIQQEKLRVISNKETTEPAHEEKPNHYCGRIGIRAPVLEELTFIKDLKLFHFMVLAILENAGPMSLPDIATRLESIGLTSRLGNLLSSLKKAWHGKEPVYKTPDGLYDVNPDSHETNYLALIAGLKDPKGLPTPPAPKPIHVKHCSEVLSKDELKNEFKNIPSNALLVSHQIAAVLEAHGEVMTLAQINAFLDEVWDEREPFTLKRVLKCRSYLFQVSADERVQLTALPTEMFAVREKLRQMAVKEATKRAQNEHINEMISQRQEYSEQREKEKQEQLSKLRRAVIYGFFDRNLLAAAVLDCEKRLISTYVGDELQQLPRNLQQFNLLAGLNVREILHGFALEALSWRIIDLGPPQKTRTINKSGRLLHIDIEMLISASVQISRPLGDPQKILSYLQNGEDTKLRRRLEANVKSLYAFYNFTRLHGVARLRWGFLDECLASPSWRIPGDISLYSIAKEAQETNTPVDIVCGSAPGWADPWSRAIRRKVLDIRGWHLIVEENGIPMQIDKMEIQAIRLASPEP